MAPVTDQPRRTQVDIPDGYSSHGVEHEGQCSAVQKPKRARVVNTRNPLHRTSAVSP